MIEKEIERFIKAHPECQFHLQFLLRECNNKNLEQTIRKVSEQISVHNRKKENLEKTLNFLLKHYN